MILGACIVWGVALSLASGGELALLRHASLKMETLILALFVIQGAARGRLPLGAEWLHMSVLVWAATGLLLLMVLVPNVGRPGISLVAIGLGLNLLVVLANGGMPVVGASAQLLHSGTLGGFYHQATSADVLTAIADVLPAPGGWMLSIGDVLLAVGIAVHLTASCKVEGSGLNSPPSVVPHEALRLD